MVKLGKFKIEHPITGYTSAMLGISRIHSESIQELQQNVRVLVDTTNDIYKRLIALEEQHASTSE